MNRLLTTTAGHILIINFVLCLAVLYMVLQSAVLRKLHRTFLIAELGYKNVRLLQDGKFPWAWYPFRRAYFVAIDAQGKQVTGLITGGILAERYQVTILDNPPSEKDLLAEMVK